ncbi:MAG: DUF3536 domain-containing protein [Gemmatimonadetes bacterium]|nr:DUF3536 domain-containing protein [Gemmatimonadota bacterium]
MPELVIHQHLYQPPREDPWLEAVPREPSAAPDHDWNQRITRECYARQAAAEVYRSDRSPSPRNGDTLSRLARRVNLYGWCSFDVGPTLCEWLASEAPATLAAMLAGDAASVRRWGHGNAMAAPYHHVILPLASPPDRTTEVRWGIADFRRRFGRAPEGFWLPECAADEDSLDLLAAEGIAFVILAPYQVEGHEGDGLPVRWNGARGRTLSILPYDGALAGDVAFGGLLRDPAALARRLAQVSEGRRGQDGCTTLATDGETFGHHHAGGESALADALALASRAPGVRLRNAAAVVAAHPPRRLVRLVSPSAWSCAHGVERWRADCGCRLDGTRPPAQQWRGPLRAALERLAAELGDVFEAEGHALFREDPWVVRDAYGAVVAEDGEALAAFVEAAVRPEVDRAGRARARVLLELQRATLRTFTSCAWFFDDVDRLEVRQVLRYAARAIELSGRAGRLASELVTWLANASSGAPGAPSAADVFVREALPHHEPAWRVAAGAMALAAAGASVPGRSGAFDVVVERRSAQPGNHAQGAPWRVTVRHRRTGVESVLVGSVRGAPPALHATVAPEGAPLGAEREVPLHDFPEAIARQLLEGHLLDDDALLAPVSG